MPERGEPLDVAGAIRLAQKVAGEMSLGQAAVSAPKAANDPAPPRSGRPDYDQMFQLKGLAPGEPYMVIRGHDKHAERMAEVYAALIAEDAAEPAMVESVLQLGDDMAAWPDKRLVNANHLSEGQIKHLRWQFSRRALRHSADCEDPRIMLAEERARTTVFNRIAGTLRNLILGGGWLNPTAWNFRPELLKLVDGRAPDLPRRDPIADIRRFLDSGGRSIDG